jgi:hypothetical protein
MDRYKILGQLQLTLLGTYETLYTCPVRVEVSYDSPPIGVDPSASVDNVQTSVTSIIICNIGAATTFNMRLVPDAVVDPTDPEYKLFVLSPIGTNETIVLSLGLVLSAGNFLQVDCAAATRLSFTAMGVEIT